MPRGGASLSERIAALQRKTSNPVPSRQSGLSPGSSHGSASGRLSSGESPSRSVSGGANAVRDRIAKFQSADVKPVVPRSSFGAGAPNPDLGGGPRRGYPAAIAGRGTGSWGEGVLRPQMTGGVWLGAGSGGGWGEPGQAPVRPQMTGGFMTSGGSRVPSYGTPGQGTPRMQRNFSASEAMPGSGRNVFADLDPDIVLTGRNKPIWAPSTPSKEPAVSPLNGSATTPKAQPEEEKLPQLPDVPVAEIDPEKAAEASAASSDKEAQDPSAKIPDFPEPPSSVPKTPVKATHREDLQATPDTSIEIGVHGRSPQDVEKLREKVREMELAPAALKEDADEPWVLQADQGPKGEVPSPLDMSEIAAASNEAQEPWVQVSGLPEADVDAAKAADPNAPGDLPQRAHVERTDSSKVDPTDPAAHEVMGPGLLVPRDEVAEAEQVGSDAVKAPLSHSVDSTVSSDDGYSGIGGAAIGSTTEDSYATHRREESDSLLLSQDVFPVPVTRSTSNGTITASASNTSTLTTTEPTPTTSPKTLSPAEKARQAIAQGRSKSQRLRRPPPGTVLSAADLDASDDDYEPGWASVISSSRS